jgi:hypothetical protein
MYEGGKIILKSDLIQSMTEQQFAIFCKGNNNYQIERNEMEEIIIWIPVED